MCNDSTLLGILSVVKRFLILIQFIVPILLIVFASLSFIKLVKNPEEKNGVKKIINQFLAAAIIFFIPTIVNILMSMLGESTKISSCWNNASSKIELSSTYKDKVGKLRKKILPDTAKYDKGVPRNLDFTCTSSVVKSQFSCETLKIVEKHLYDFDATNFNSVISSYGGFENYAKSVGGIFGKYYGQQMPNVTETDFQKAAEYVLGWMYMYGWDYMNTQGEHYKWGTGSKYSNDAFYVNGGWRREYSGKFDDLIAGKNGLDMLSSECGDLEIFVYWKLGISRKRSIANPTSLRELKVGDALFFYDMSGGRKNWRHTVLVGEVYDDKIVCYDAGSRFTRSRNYKYTVEIPNDNSASAELIALKKHYAYDGWIAKRYYNFEEG